MRIENRNFVKETVITSSLSGCFAFGKCDEIGIKPWVHIKFHSWKNQICFKGPEICRILYSWDLEIPHYIRKQICFVLGIPWVLRIFLSTSLIIPFCSEFLRPDLRSLVRRCHCIRKQVYPAKPLGCITILSEADLTDTLPVPSCAKLPYFNQLLAFKPPYTRIGWRELF